MTIHGSLVTADLSRAGMPIETYSNHTFYPLDPRIEDVRLEDIAHALAMQCRYGGHCTKFYSVAQHSVLVSTLVPPQDALQGLLHDASEAYLCDIPRPLKHGGGLEGYLEIEESVQRVIMEAFDVPFELSEAVGEADQILLFTEARDLMASGGLWWGNNGRFKLPEKVIVPWSPGLAEEAFLERFAFLTEEL